MSISPLTTTRQSPKKFDVSSSALRSLSEIPPKYRHIFASYESFNEVQSKVFDKILYSDEPVVISAPTGSGKTAMFELAILRLLMRLDDLEIAANSEDIRANFKIVYVAPVKALCTEKFADWREKFDPLGLECLEATGDSELGDFNRLSTAKLVITTPEKWDSLTRKWKDSACILEAVKLFIIDEVHLVNEDVRGPTLEAIVSRMKTMLNSKQVDTGHADDGLRFIAASATIPNIEDLAAWLGGKIPASYFQISESLRPVKLQKHVLGYNLREQGFRFDMNLNYKLAGVIKKYSSEKPTLIFCNSRKSTEMASKALFGEFSLISLSDIQKLELIQISKCLTDTKLKQLVVKGIAYHHAGLSYQDRAVIEEAFRKSFILILLCTNTLAMGVNFPAHLVIIKSTESYIHGTLAEYSESCILQMIGRAGRPQFDLNGVAVIMTQQKNVKKYENLMNGCTPVESHLHKHLAEHLNSEIVLQTVTDLEVAMKWIRSTFLYVRAVKCPMNYGFAFGMTRESVEKKLEEMCLIQINALERNGLIVKDQTFGLTIASTSFGRLMTRYYISFDTMKLFRQLHGNESFLAIFNTIIRCHEFSDFTLRVSDKKALNAINNKPIRFPIKGKVKTNEDKISCLIQAIFGNITISDPAMAQDALRMIRLGEKVSKCLSEYLRLSENNFCNKTYKAVLHATIVAKCFPAKLWNNSDFVSKQLKKIGTVYSSLLVNAGKTTFKSILETSPRQLEMILKKSPPFGDEIIEIVSSFPDYDLELKIKSSNFLQVIITQLNTNFIYDGRNSVIIIGDGDNNLLFYNNKVDLIIFEAGIFDRTIPIKNQDTNFIQGKLIHENLVGVDREKKIILKIDDDLNDLRKSNPKIQSKLRVKRTKGSTIPKEIDDVQTSLLNDDEYFENIDAISALYGEMNESNFIETQVEVVNSPVDCIKRKLDDFEHFDRPKISKISSDDRTEYDRPVFTSEPSNSTMPLESILDEEIPDPEMFDEEILHRLMDDQFQMEENFINSQISKHFEEADTNPNELMDDLMVPLDLSMSKNFDLDQIATNCCETSEEPIGPIRTENNCNKQFTQFKLLSKLESSHIGQENKHMENNTNGIGASNTMNDNEITEILNLKKISKLQNESFNLVASQPIKSTSNQQNHTFLEPFPVDEKTSKYFRPKVQPKRGIMINLKDKIESNLREIERQPERNKSQSDLTDDNKVFKSKPLQKSQDSFYEKMQRDPQKCLERAMTPNIPKKQVRFEEIPVKFSDFNPKKFTEIDKNQKNFEVRESSKLSTFKESVDETCNQSFENIKINSLRNSQSKIVQTKQTSNIFEISKTLIENAAHINLENILIELCDNRLSKANDHDAITTDLGNFETEFSASPDKKQINARFFIENNEDKKYSLPNISIGPNITDERSKGRPKENQVFFNKTFQIQQNFSENAKFAPVHNNNMTKENIRIDNLFKNVENEPEKIIIVPEKSSRFRLNISRTSKNIVSRKPEFQTNENAATKLNKSNDSYMDELSKIMLVDVTNFGPKGERSNSGTKSEHYNYPTTSLPKPNFEASTSKRRNSLIEILSPDNKFDAKDVSSTSNLYSKIPKFNDSLLEAVSSKCRCFDSNKFTNNQMNSTATRELFSNTPWPDTTDFNCSNDYCTIFTPLKLSQRSNFSFISPQSAQKESISWPTGIIDLTLSPVFEKLNIAVNNQNEGEEFYKSFVKNIGDNSNLKDEKDFDFSDFPL